MSGEPVKLTSGSTIDLHRLEVIGDAEHSDVDSTPVMKVDSDAV